MKPTREQLEGVPEHKVYKGLCPYYDKIEGCDCRHCLGICYCERWEKPYDFPADYAGWRPLSK